MGLHKNLLVDRANLPAELICSLCAHVLLQPYQVFCSQDHVFCQACLDSYLEDCIADRPSEDNITHCEQIHQLDSTNLHQHAMEFRETEPIPLGPTLSEEVTVACPECSRMQEEPERLRVSAFRPAKFIQRMISAQTIRCPTTMARSCQWTGPMEDVETHLGVCGFAVEYHCPHHQFGCNFRGTVIDIVAHMPACHFCGEDRSIDTAHSNTLDDSHISHLPDPLNGPPSPPRSSPVLNPLHSYVDQARSPIQAQKSSLQSEHSKIAIDEFDQDEFSGLLEDMDMSDIADLTISHGPTPVPACLKDPEANQKSVGDQGQGPLPACIKDPSDQELVCDQSQTQELAATPHSQIPIRIYDDSQELGATSFPEMGPEQASVPPTPYPRRRRRIIEEEPSQVTEEEEEADTAPREISDSRTTVAEITQEHSTDSACPVAQSPTRSRVLQEIPTPLPNRPSGLSLSPETYDYVGSSQQSARFGDPHHQLPRKLKLRLKMRQPRSPSSSPPIPQPTAVNSRVLQFQGSWPCEVHRRSKFSLSEQDESSPIVTIADISRVASPVSIRSLSPSSPSSEFARFASIVRHTSAGPYHSAEPHAFLPLLTHEPRYLRSRRRVLRRRTYGGSPLPSVHAVYERSRGKLWTEPITPDITSAENSFSSLRASITSSAHKSD